MKYIGRRQSSNVEDRRRMSGGKKTVFGGGIVGLIILAVVYFAGGGDVSQFLQELQQQGSQTEQSSNAAIDPGEDEMAEYISVALADNEDVWNKIFSENGMVYSEPKLVLYREGTQSGCGNASSAIGPFYCPADEKVYIDLGFFEELQSRFGAAEGDFAISYVLAHEVGHHVQHLLGVSEKVSEKQQSVSEKEANKLSVALELQADFYAGIWTYYTQKYKNVLEEGDIEEALSAASAVGDDKIQKKSQGYIVPDAFTHGTSEQRMYWFKKGYNTGDIEQGNTFEELGYSL
jgi:predicted metalloprotease